MISVNKMDKSEDEIRFVCISDTHGRINFPVPEGDVLIHAGDLTSCTSMNHFIKTIQWLSELPHKLKIVTAGNHDEFLDPIRRYPKERKKILDMMKEHNILYLEHEKYQLPDELGGFVLFVSPYAPIHYDGAFMLKDLSSRWDDIDDTIDILVTHTPPFGHLDKIRYNQKSVGCPFLRHRIDTVILPQVHIFGHIHESHGYEFNSEGQLFINASMFNYRRKDDQEPIYFDITKK